MNAETRRFVLMLIYSYTTFAITKIIWLTEHDEITTVLVKGRGKSFAIKYNRGTDMFQGHNSKHEKTELFVDMLSEWIQKAK
jgi:hypothetical protein